MASSLLTLRLELLKNCISIHWIEHQLANYRIYISLSTTHSARNLGFIFDENLTLPSLIR